MVTGARGKVHALRLKRGSFRNGTNNEARLTQKPAAHAAVNRRQATAGNTKEKAK
jgi:hypothetical protein